MYNHNTINSFNLSNGGNRDSLSLIDFQVNDAVNKSFSTIKKVEYLIHEGIEKSALSNYQNKPSEEKENKEKEPKKESDKHEALDKIRARGRLSSASARKIPSEKVLKLEEMNNQRKVKKSRPKFRSKSSNFKPKMKVIIPDIGNLESQEPNFLLPHQQQQLKLFNFTSNRAVKNHPSGKKAPLGSPVHFRQNSQDNTLENLNINPILMQSPPPDHVSQREIKCLNPDFEGNEEDQLFLDIYDFRNNQLGVNLSKFQKQRQLRKIFKQNMQSSQYDSLNKPDDQSSFNLGANRASLVKDPLLQNFDDLKRRRINSESKPAQDRFLNMEELESCEEGKSQSEEEKMQAVDSSSKTMECSAYNSLNTKNFQQSGFSSEIQTSAKLQTQGSVKTPTRCTADIPKAKLRPGSLRQRPSSHIMSHEATQQSKKGSDILAVASTRIGTGIESIQGYQRILSKKINQTNTNSHANPHPLTKQLNTDQRNKSSNLQEPSQQPLQQPIQIVKKSGHNFNYHFTSYTYTDDQQKSQITGWNERTLIGYSSILRSNNDMVNQLENKLKPQNKIEIVSKKESNSEVITLQKYEPNPEVEKIKKEYLNKENVNSMNNLNNASWSAKRSKSCNLKDKEVSNPERPKKQSRTARNSQNVELGNSRSSSQKSKTQVSGSQCSKLVVSKSVPKYSIRIKPKNTQAYTPRNSNLENKKSGVDNFIADSKSGKSLGLGASKLNNGTESSLFMPHPSFTPVNRSQALKDNNKKALTSEKLAPEYAEQIQQKMNENQSTGQFEGMNQQIPVGENFFDSGSYQAEDLYAQFGFSGPKKVESENITVSKGRSSQNQDLVSYVVSRRQGKHRASQYVGSQDKIGLNFNQNVSPSKKFEYSANLKPKSTQIAKERERFSNRTHAHAQFTPNQLSNEFKQRISGIELKNQSGIRNSRDFGGRMTQQNSQVGQKHILVHGFQKGFDSQVSKLTPVIPTVTITNNPSIRSPCNRKGSPSKNQLDSPLNLTPKVQQSALECQNKIDFSSLEFPSGMMGITPKLSKEQGDDMDLNSAKVSHQMNLSKYQASEKDNISENSQIEEMEDEYFVVSRDSNHDDVALERERPTIEGIAKLVYQSNKGKNRRTPVKEQVIAKCISFKTDSSEENEHRNPEIYDETPQKVYFKHDEKGKHSKSYKSSNIHHQKSHSHQIVSTEFQKLPPINPLINKHVVSHFKSLNQASIQLRNQSADKQIQTSDISQTKKSELEPDVSQFKENSYTVTQAATRLFTELPSKINTPQKSHHPKTEINKVGSITKYFLEASPISHRKQHSSFNSPRFNPLGVDISAEECKKSNSKSQDRSTMKQPVLRKSPTRNQNKEQGIGSKNKNRKSSISPSRCPVLATFKNRNNRLDNPLQVDISRHSSHPYSNFKMRPKYGSPTRSGGMYEVKKKQYPYAKIGCYAYSYLLEKLEPGLKYMFKVGTKNFRALYLKMSQQYQEEHNQRNGLVHSLTKQEANLETINHSHSVQYLQEASKFVLNMNQKRQFNENLAQNERCYISPSEQKKFNIRSRLMAKRIEVLKKDVQTHSNNLQVLSDLHSKDTKEILSNFGPNKGTFDLETPNLNTRMAFNSPEELRHKLYIFRLSNQTKIAKKYRHSAQLQQKVNFFKFEYSTKVSVLESTRDQVKFSEKDYVQNKKFKIDVDMVVRKWHCMMNQDSSHKKGNLYNFQVSKSSILSKYQLSQSSKSGIQYQKSISESQVQKSHKWSLDFQDPNFDYPKFYSKKKKFVRLYHDLICQTRTGEDIRASVNYIWSIILEKNIPENNWASLMKVFDINRGCGMFKEESRRRIQRQSRQQSSRKNENDQISGLTQKEMREKRSSRKLNLNYFQTLILRVLE